MTRDIDPTVAARAAEALPILLDAALRAGEIALAHFRPGERTSSPIAYKEGNSPVTEADLAVDAYLRERCAAEFPQAGWLSEETADNSLRLSRTEIVIADPIDGTRAFMSGDPRWCVAIGLALRGRPIAGVVHAPALATTYAAAHGHGATRDGARICASSHATLRDARIGGPRPMMQSLSASAGVAFSFEPRIPSLALRLVRVADGELDVALASPDSHDWDVAAADIVLEEAGAALWRQPGGALAYNGATTTLPALAAAPLALAPELAAALTRALAARRS